MTVKMLYREGELVRLKPENAEHKDIVVPADRAWVLGRMGTCSIRLSGEGCGLSLYVCVVPAKGIKI